MREATNKFAAPPPNETGGFLLPGQWALVQGQGVLRTVLGSCLAVALWHPRLRLATLCHATRPARQPAGASSADTEPLDGRYLDEAMRLMVNALAQHGADPRACEARLIGGGELLSAFCKTVTSSVGAQNVAAARRLAQTHGLRVVQEDLGGRQSRQVALDGCTGALTVRSNLVRPASSRLY